MEYMKKNFLLLVLFTTLFLLVIFLMSKKVMLRPMKEKNMLDYTKKESRSTEKNNKNSTKNGNIKSLKASSKEDITKITSNGDLEIREAHPSRFVLEINDQILLEQDLARDISSIYGVKKVRVHLSLSKLNLPPYKREATGASIVIEQEKGISLSQSESDQIIFLVSDSVKEILPENIVVLDQKGNKL